MPPKLKPVELTAVMVRFVAGTFGTLAGTTAIEPSTASLLVQSTPPADTMHSFAGENNKIVWSIKVEGEIPIWPDVNEEFEIKVLPAGGAR